MRAFSILAASALALSMAAAVDTADAACKRFGFTVNDYGKEGPTNDAKSLLDKHVAKWAAESGISNYRVSKKDVKCELFLDFVVFDEYTCTASANVCWGADISKIAPSEDTAADSSETPPAPMSKVAAGLKREKAAAATAEAEAPASAAPPSETAAAAPAETPPAAAEEVAAPVEQAAEQAPPPAVEPPTSTASVPAAADEKPEVAVSNGSPVVETGALGDSAMPDVKAMVPHDDATASTSDDQSAAASSAAAAAAAAAERAAAAAETAAAAAKEAAAAAVAASAANRGVIVPPIDAR